MIIITQQEGNEYYSQDGGNGNMEGEKDIHRKIDKAEKYGQYRR